MKNFNMDDFFAAFSRLKARGNSQVKGCQMNNAPSKSCSCESSKGRWAQQAYDRPDEDVQFNMNDNCGCSSQASSARERLSQMKSSGSATNRFTCRHTAQEEPSCPCEPQEPQEPHCPCEPKQPKKPVQPQRPQRPCRPQQPQSQSQALVDVGDIKVDNSTKVDNRSVTIDNSDRSWNNNGIIDGAGDDIYGMGNRGIIDTAGDDIYARNYSVNTFNTTNNFNKTIIQKEDPDPDPPGPSPGPDPDPPGPSPGPTPTFNLTPLRSLLTNLEAFTPDGVLADDELADAMINPTLADLDGDPSKISNEEMAIFNQIKEFNKDKDLITNVIKGNYANISESTLEKLAELSDTIKKLTDSN